MADAPKTYRVDLVAVGKARRKAIVSRQAVALDGDDAWIQVRDAFRRPVRLLNHHGIGHAIHVEPLR